MLKYLKRQKSRRRKSENDDNSNDDDCKSSAGGDSSSSRNFNDKRNSLRSTSSFCDEIFFEELLTTEVDEADTVSCGTSSLKSVGVGGMCVNEDIFKYHSRLSICLTSIVNEPNCLSHFVQFLESKDALALIKFYLDIENFKTAAKSQWQTDSQNTKIMSALDLDQQFAVHEQNVETKNKSDSCDRVEKESDDEKINKVPELKTLCDLSMRKPITDDEKSQICAETNKQLTICTNNNNKNNLNNNNNNLRKENYEKSRNDENLTEYMDSISAASLNDAMAIYQKYLNVKSPQFISLPVTILTQISLLLCNQDDANDTTGVSEVHQQQPQQHLNNVTSSCFEEAQKYVLHELESNYLHEFLQSSFYAKYCVDLIESTCRNDSAALVQQEQLNIYDILFSEVALFFFMEFLEQHNERECLDFWTTAINFRKTFADKSIASNTNEAEMQADAMQIYEKFFSLQAEERLWSSDRLRSWVEEHICASGEVAQAFDLPLHVISKYLERKYLFTFLQSQIFGNYVNELKIKINSEQEDSVTNVKCTAGSVSIQSFQKLGLRRTQSTSSVNKKHLKTMSDSSNHNTQDLSRNNVCKQNTLLAMMDPVQRPKSNAGSTMQIDSLQLSNPNLLWQRSTNKEGRLTFGRVNSLGRYERDFDVCHDITTNGCGLIGSKHNAWSLSVGGNKLKKAMRKLVNLQEDEVQEEIAWQVAEMIVNDVTNVTLRQHNDDSTCNVSASKAL